MPAIRTDCRAVGAVEIVAAGASIGAFNAVASLCRHPDVFRTAIALSGTYDLEKLFGFRADENFYFSSPLLFLPNLGEGRAARAAAPPLRPPRLRPGPLGGPGGILAHGRRARRQGHSQPR